MSVLCINDYNQKQYLQSCKFMKKKIVYVCISSINCTVINKTYMYKKINK